MAQSCPADCDGDHTVVVTELVTAVSIALGSAPLSSCPAADTDGDQNVRIPELVAAVNAALNGCPTPAAVPSPTPTAVASPTATPTAVAAGDPAAAALAVVRGLAQVPELAQVLTLAVDALSGPQMCALGGSEQSACEDSGAGTTRDPVTADHCRISTLEAPIDFNGSVTITASGNCQVPLPTNIGFVFAEDAVLEASDSSPPLDVRLDAKLTIDTLKIGNPPCHIKGAVVTINGPVVFHGPAGHDVTLAFDMLKDDIQFRDFNDSCDPLTIVTTLDGPVRIDDTYGQGPFGLGVTLHDYVITSHRSTQQFDLDGRVDAPCLGVGAHFVTTTPVGIALDLPCFTGGTLAVGLPTGTAQLALDAEGGVAVSGGAMPSAVYASCLGLPRNACE